MYVTLDTSHKISVKYIKIGDYNIAECTKW